ncbi:MAG: GNAT family N-acetyltransferase [Candidatus Brennerbacteria bacterium]|nr:GNAT family N-acetyltransferase [Candidatus Brennerbacteria bacterium]
MQNNKFKFYLKKVENLTKQEKEQMMRLMVATYPPFKKYYLKNKYYSTVKPQMENLIKESNKIVGVGKLMWRKVMVETKSVKFFAFGVLIAKKYQKQGLGSKLIVKNIKEAKKRGADILYGSTLNPVAEKIVQRLGFQKLNIAIFYKDVESGKIKTENGRVWVFEYKKGLLRKIEKLSKFYIGAGPL